MECWLSDQNRRLTWWRLRYSQFCYHRSEQRLHQPAPRCGLWWRKYTSLALVRSLVAQRRQCRETGPFWQIRQTYPQWKAHIRPRFAAGWKLLRAVHKERYKLIKFWGAYSLTNEVPYSIWPKFARPASIMPAGSAIDCLKVSGLKTYILAALNDRRP